MIMQRTETDLVSSNANLLVGLAHLNWWTAAEMLTNQTLVRQHTHTHTPSSCSVHVDREWRRRRKGSIPHWLTAVFVVHLNKVCHIHRLTIPTHTHRSQSRNHRITTSTHREWYTMHKALQTHSAHKIANKQRLEHTHTALSTTQDTQSSLTWLAWLCTCDPFPQHPATRLFPTVLDLPSGLEVRGKGRISFCFPSSQSTSIALAPKFIISNTQCHNHGVPHTTKLMLKLIYQALMQVYSNTVGGGWERGWYQLAGCRAKYYW